jgi:hypothetical protein
VVVWYLLDEGSWAVLRIRIGVIPIRRHCDARVEGRFWYCRVPPRLSSRRKH